MVRPVALPDPSPEPNKESNIMFNVMTDGVLFCRRETHEEAELAIAKARAESVAEIERLLDLIHESKAFAASLIIKESR